jgi:hypothetical protein
MLLEMLQIPPGHWHLMLGVPDRDSKPLGVSGHVPDVQYVDQIGAVAPQDHGVVRETVADSLDGVPQQVFPHCAVLVREHFHVITGRFDEEQAGGRHSYRFLLVVRGQGQGLFRMGGVRTLLLAAIQTPVDGFGLADVFLKVRVILKQEHEHDRNEPDRNRVELKTQDILEQGIAGMHGMKIESVPQTDEKKQPEDIRDDIPDSDLFRKEQFWKELWHGQVIGEPDDEADQTEAQIDGYADQGIARILARFEGFEQGQEQKNEQADARRFPEYGPEIVFVGKGLVEEILDAVSGDFLLRQIRGAYFQLNHINFHPSIPAVSRTVFQASYPRPRSAAPVF